MDTSDTDFRLTDHGHTTAEQQTAVVPLLKWAGGKRWLAPKLRELAPVKYDHFIEPFLGGAATFFALAPSKAFLSDTNADLIDCYRAIAEDWSAVVRQLGHHQRNHDDDYYYQVRGSNPRTPASRASRFIYLNRTCWNGLYRVNLRGEFNVPKGTKTAVLMRSDNFPAAAALLRRAKLSTSDFERTVDRAGRHDFVFVDPPYTVRHNNNGFIKYNEKLFSWGDQERLRDAVLRAQKRGAKVLVSNADHKSVRDLYKGVGEILTVPRSSVIAGSSENRRATTELLIKTY
jgi:DNA adenine methylase